MVQKKTTKSVSVRLPKHCVPETYYVTLEPDLESFTFAGEEVIAVSITKPTKQITMHAAEVELLSADFLPAQKKSTKQKATRTTRAKQAAAWACKISYNTKAETVTLKFPKVLPVGKGKLHITFRGILGDSLRGYYRSSFSHNGTTKYLATTQFEATDARRAFPCFDEPALKAVFHVKLVVPMGHEAVSNTVATSVAEHRAGFKVITFAPTPRMSTYLLAFVSGELEHIQKKTKSGVLVRVFTTPGKKAKAQFALDCAVKVLEFYQKYFEIPYPLPALDLLGIPDFAAGAMENWGAVTFSETELLLEADNSAAATKQRVALVVAHELAHQWFGNLVTMEWWTHLWLNEGFASYMEYVALDHLFPEWHMWEQFLTNDYVDGLAKDQLLHTHPIEVPVHHPSEIDEIFDDISYRKGSSVIRMLAAYLGAEDFRKGLVHYLQKHSYANASTGDLWYALEQVSGKPVQKLMAAWTTQAGFPLVTFAGTEQGTTFTQQRFYINPQTALTTKSAQVWPVPIRLQTVKGAQHEILLTKREEVVPVSAVVKGNVGESGFYYIGYTPAQITQLVPLVQKKKLSNLDRWGVLHTAFTLCEAGKLPADAVLELLAAYRKETDYIVVSELISGLMRMSVLYTTEKWYKQFQAYVCFVLAPTVKRLGWHKRAGEAHGDSLLRPQALYAMGVHGDEQTVVTALGLFADIVKKGVDAVPADVRSVVYRLTAREGGLPEFQFLQRLYRETDSQDEQRRLAAGLSAFRSVGIMERALAFGFSSAVRRSDAWLFCAYTSLHPHAHATLWRFVQAHWSTVQEYYGTGGQLLGRIVECLGSFQTEKEALQVAEFFRRHPVPGAARTIQQTLEQIRITSAWRKRDTAMVARFIRAFRK